MPKFLHKIISKSQKDMGYDESTDYGELELDN